MTTAPPARYRPLGAYRFALALMVATQHFQHLLPPDQRGIFVHGGFGAIAVAAFFAVSGFVVAEALASFYAGRPGAFLLNRVLRLAPPYFAALALSVAVHAALWPTGHLILWDYRLTGPPLTPARLLTGLLGLVPGFNPRWLGQDVEFVPFVWSLRLEMAFYAAAALTMAAAWRRDATWPVPTAMLLALAATATFLLITHRPSALSTAPMFLAGAAWFLREARPGPWRTALLALCLCAATAGFASWHQHGAPILPLQLTILAALLALCAALSTRPISGPLKHLDRRLGDLSYPLYLNHYAVGIGASSLLPSRGWPLLALSLTAAVLLAATAHRLVDTPLRTLRDRIRRTAV